MTKGKKQVKSPDSPELSELLKNLMKDQFKAVCEQAKKNAKLGDWLKTMEVYRKMVPDESARKKLWKDLEVIRRKVLAQKKDDQSKDSTAARRGKRKK